MDALNRRTALHIAGISGLGLAGCAPQPAETPPTPSHIPAAPTSPAPSPSSDNRPRWPLTGHLLEDAAAPMHAAVAVKVPDNEREHPQAGINDADIVFVELDGYPDSDGYSSTRLMPVYHATMPPDVAPVRSIRPTDVPLLAPITAVLASSGGSGWVKNYVAQFSEFIVSDLTYLAMKGTDAYSVNKDRIRVYQGDTYYDRALVCHPGALSQASEAFPDGPPAAYFPFATDVDQPSAAAGQAATHVGVPWKGDGYLMGYDFDAASGTYLRSMPWGEHVQLDGARVTTDNVLVIKAAQYTDKLAEGDGNAEPIQDLIDAGGEFLYATGGKYVTGTWAKKAVDSPFEFTLDDKTPLLMTPGRTFVEIPNDDAVIVVE
ncbi:MAG: DUF3048 domain-containing protein [Arachnia sp.]